jgi:hypothetical protein
VLFDRIAEGARKLTYRKLGRQNALKSYYNVVKYLNIRREKSEEDEEQKYRIPLLVDRLENCYFSKYGFLDFKLSITVH